MAIEPGTDAAFMPGRVFVNTKVTKTLVGIPDQFMGRALDREHATALISNASAESYIEHDRNAGLHLIITGTPAFHGGKFTAAVADTAVFGWRGSCRRWGAAGAYSDTPAAGGVTLTTNDTSGANYIARVFTRLHHMFQGMELQGHSSKNEVVILKWFRRHPNRTRNRDLAEAAHADVLTLIPGVLEFMRGWRSATVVRAHKVIT